MAAVNKAVIYAAPGTTKTEIRIHTIPEPGPGEILVRISHTGVCHSDLGVCLEAWPALPHPTLPGQIGGHEGVGTVVKQGPGVDKPEIDSRVGIKWLSDVCNKCASCIEDDDASCINPKISGYYTPGTFQQYVVTSATYATPIPDNVDSAEAAPILCAGVTVYSGLKKIVPVSGTAAGTWVVISGAGGGLGHLAIQYARAMGMRVIAIDHGSKENFCVGLGAETFLDYTKFDDEKLQNQIIETTGGRGAHGVLVLAASNKSYEQAMSYLRPRGIVVCIGMPEGESVPIQKAFPAVMALKQFRIAGSAIGNRHEVIEALDLVSRGHVKCHYKIEKMDRLSQVLEDMRSGKVQGRVVLDMS